MCDNLADHTEEFQALRPMLFSIAYRMTGSVGDAEDIVSEAFVRLQATLTEGCSIRSMKSFTATVVTRLSIDHLKSARVRREQYFGVWLPEPLVASELPDGPSQAELSESISVAFLVVLESLSPVERAVFVLHDVFKYEYEEIAPIIDKSVPNCRQIAARARRAVAARRPRFEASEAARKELADRFFRAVEIGDLAGLVELLAADAVAYGDGGGRGPSFSRPIVGQAAVGGMFRVLIKKILQFDLRLEHAMINGQPGVLVCDANGDLLNVLTVDVADGRIQVVRSILNPDKLGHLGPLVPEEHPLRGGGHGTRD